MRIGIKLALLAVSVDKKLRNSTLSPEVSRLMAFWPILGSSFRAPPALLRNVELFFIIYFPSFSLCFIKERRGFSAFLNSLYGYALTMVLLIERCEPSVDGLWTQGECEKNPSGPARLEGCQGCEGSTL